MNKYYPKGVCSSLIEYEINSDDTIKTIKVTNGCNGNLKGIAKLCEGRSVSEVISLLDGIKCGNKDTSCPDQIAKALYEYKNKKNGDVV
ncbi:MAG: TIGR03905 family TSCPD domain-containing protein [Bacilli bacterium]|nr:TIGR03905 family TSCPD domain-containing protein [Bacilli bacterium]